MSQDRVWNKEEGCSQAEYQQQGSAQVSASAEGVVAPQRQVLTRELIGWLETKYCN